MNPKCDECGRFVSYEDLINGRAVNKMVTPDSELTTETFETLCPKHNECNKENKNGVH
jgi:hypothetical protein